MSIKKLISAALATALSLSAFAAMTVSAATTPTGNETYTVKAMDAADIAAYNEEMEWDVPGAGFIISFDNFADANAGAIQFKVAIPEDLVIEGRKANDPLDAENVVDGMITDMNFKVASSNILDNKNGLNIFSFQIVPKVATGFELGELAFLFAADDEGYVAPEGAFEVTDARFGYFDSPNAFDVKVVAAGEEPDPVGPSFTKIDLKSSDERGEVDSAVGFYAEYKDGISGSLSFNGVATLLAGGTENYSLTVDVPTIEGTAKVGLIVAFDGTVYSDFNLAD